MERLSMTFTANSKQQKWNFFHLSSTVCTVEWNYLYLQWIVGDIIYRLQQVKPWSQYWLIAAGAYPGFCSMKRLGVFLLPLDRMLVHRRSLPRNLLGFPNNSPVPIYTPRWREAPWELVSCLRTQQCPLARARTLTTRSRDERINHEATAPPTRELKIRSYPCCLPSAS